MTLLRAKVTEFVEIVEVGPRDGLQSQPKLFDTATKLAFIERLIDAGAKRLEVVSFVNPKRVPQMADADEVIRSLPRRPDLQYIGLVLNTRGFERAAALGLKEINSVVVATESFSQRNQGMSVAVIMDSVATIAREARNAGIKCGVTIAASFGCPYEGRVPPATVTELVRRLLDFGIDELALADSIGVAVPTQVAGLLEQVKPLCGSLPFRMHFHNTRNTAIANIYAALNAGVRAFDASCGGLGGCPFAPGATGNVGTEDLLYLLQNSGFETTYSLPAVIATTKWLEGPLAASLPAALSRATVFPPVLATHA
ncbi:MAG: hydroxymethylglutaryl-CoA lyase [Gammaproteobacteria bacterium]|nr:hydroxymethylglutaryl-CoA lyase [Gammaproteobacteria bacterium]